MSARLNPTGVSMLLVYGAKLLPPRAEGPNGPARPGIRVTVDAQGTCLLEAVGYGCASTGQAAIKDAEQVCKDAKLIVTTPPRWVETRHPARIVRRG